MGVGYILHGHVFVMKLFIRNTLSTFVIDLLTLPLLNYFTPDIKHLSVFFKQTFLLNLSLNKMLRLHAPFKIFQLSGDTFADDKAGYALFWDFQEANNAILEPRVNLALEMFPFLRFLPGKYKRIYNMLKLRVRAIEQEFAEKALVSVNFVSAIVVT